MSVPWIFSELEKMKNGLMRVDKEVNQEETLEGDNRYDAANSGMTNKLTSQPQANNRKVRSCHKATNVKTKTVLSMTFFDPPNGT
jgi:hypothetical protein